jgi:hypothetical protein
LKTAVTIRYLQQQPALRVDRAAGCRSAPPARDEVDRELLGQHASAPSQCALTCLLCTLRSAFS